MKLEDLKRIGDRRPKGIYTREEGGVAVVNGQDIRFIRVDDPDAAAFLALAANYWDELISLIGWCERLHNHVETAGPVGYYNPLVEELELLLEELDKE